MMYEAVLLVPLAWLLIRLRHQQAAPGTVLGIYLVSAGVIRFAIEFLRINERVVGPLSVAHIAALLAIAAGLLILATARGGPAHEPALSRRH
jgi:prolipoprotein diacylglyceryltransferase